MKIYGQCSKRPEAALPKCKKGHSIDFISNPMTSFDRKVSTFLLFMEPPENPNEKATYIYDIFFNESIIKV
ncbi:hypothetical protein CN380_21220 [Bacillus sp. AFS017274]|nr:hypothetical protein CN380_21220 [Bacillus sp. AFS017274]